MKKIFIAMVACFAALAANAQCEKKCEKTGDCKPNCEQVQKCRKPIANHVIIIGLDGLAGNTLDSADMPVTKALMAQGCVTRNKRCALPSVSAPNWATLFMGSNTELHGYTQWGSKHPELPSRVIVKNNIYPTIFQIYRDADPKAEIGAMYEWSGIKFLVDTLSCSHFAKSDNYKTNRAELSEMAAEYIKAKQPNLLVAVYNIPDDIGHEIGWRTPEYYAELHEADAYINNIVEATKEAGIYDDTVFIITSDHGGINKGHGGYTLDEMETPMIIVGKGIRKGVELQSSIGNMDVAPTIARILDIEDYIPQVWTGSPIAEVFE